MKSVAKQMGTALMISLMVIGMLSLVYAKSQQDDADDREGASWLEAGNVGQEKESSDDLSKLREMTKQGVSSEMKEYLSVKKAEEEIEDIQKKHNIKKYVEDLKKEESFNEGKTLQIVKYAALVAERLIDKIELMKKRVMDDKDFMAVHPGAVERLGKVQKEVSSIHEQLTQILSDGKLTRDEWTKQAVPALKDLRKVIIQLKEKEQGFFNEWRHKHAQDAARHLIKKMMEKREKMRENLLKEGLSQQEVAGIMAKVDQEMEALKKMTVQEAGSGKGMSGPGVATRPSMDKMKMDAHDMKESMEKIKKALEGKGGGKHNSKKGSGKGSDKDE